MPKFEKKIKLLLDPDTGRMHRANITVMPCTTCGDNEGIAWIDAERCARRYYKNKSKILFERQRFMLAVPIISIMTFLICSALAIFFTLGSLIVIDSVELLDILIITACSSIPVLFVSYFTQKHVLVKGYARVKERCSDELSYNQEIIGLGLLNH